MSSPDQSKGSRSRDELLAGEYVLGVLSPDDRQKVEARMRSDRSFAAIVSRWEQNLSTFSDEYETLTPPAGILAKADKRVPGAGRSGMSLWNSLPIWRGIAFASLFLAAGVLFFSITGGSLAPPAKPLLADLAAPNSAISLVTSYNLSSGRLKVTPVASEQAESKSLQLWLVRGGSAPISLGVLPQSGQGEITVPAEARRQFTLGATISVSLEPLGGSTTGTPSGPIVASGTTRSF